MRYHERASQRERVIESLSAELDELRRGERRSLLRPVLLELCRLRNDLLKQANDLPSSFTSEDAGDLLRSYAETVELALEDGGVRPFDPDVAEPFDIRRHRRVGSQPTQDEALIGMVAVVRRSGYLEAEMPRPLTPADVVVYERSAAPLPVAAEPSAGDLLDSGTDGTNHDDAQDEEDV